jgi:hypothetical protein
MKTDFDMIVLLTRKLNRQYILIFCVYFIDGILYEITLFTYFSFSLSSSNTVRISRRVSVKYERPFAFDRENDINGTNYRSINSAILSLSVRGEFPSRAARVYDNTT